MSKEYKQGASHKKLGFSIHYNPYRNKGSARQFTNWVDGHKGIN